MTIKCKKLRATHSERTCAMRFKMAAITTDWVPTLSRFSPESTYPIDLSECKGCPIGKKCLDKIGTKNIVLRGNGQLGKRRMGLKKLEKQTRRFNELEVK